MMSVMTLEERERHAYASGDPSAPLLALALDGDEDLAADVQWSEEMQRAAERERDAAEDLLREAITLLTGEHDPDAVRAWLDENRDRLPS